MVISTVKVEITINAISESKHKYLRCIMKQTIYRLYTSSKQMKLANYRWPSSTKEMNEYRSYKLACTEQPYVLRTQLAIATPRGGISIITQLAKTFTDRLKSLTSRNEFESCNEQSYVRTQLDTATERSKIIKIKLISVKNHAYLLLTTFADPS